MAMVLWDASGFAKRYAPELGSDVVVHLLTLVPAAQMAITMLGYAETYSILLRKQNSRVISSISFALATSALTNEVLNERDFQILAVDDAAILIGIALMKRHNLNSSDAAILAAYLRYARLPGSPPCLLVASDQRLLRAASAEGLATLNPELLLPADVPGTLASL